MLIYLTSGIFIRSSVNTPSGKHFFKNVFGKQTKKEWDVPVKEFSVQYSPSPVVGNSRTGQGGMRTAILQLLVSKPQCKALATVEVNQLKAYMRNRNISDS